jgi:uncharacterized protein (TIGR04255 family)
MASDWFPTLKHAPIVEALVDVWVAFPQKPEPDRFRALHAEFQPAYPTVEPLQFAQIAFKAAPGQMPQGSGAGPTFRGFAFKSADGKRIIQSRIDGFTFNRLEPYGTWAEFVKEAESAWKKYREAFPAATVTKVNLKYVNQIRILIEGQPVNLEEFFVNPPKGPPTSEITLASFVTQLYYFDEASGFHANWILARQPTPDARFLNVILDIEVFLQSPQLAADADPLSFLPKMRHLKNTLFFNTFTAKGISLFQ